MRRDETGMKKLIRYVHIVHTWCMKHSSSLSLSLSLSPLARLGSAQDKFFSFFGGGGGGACFLGGF